MEAHWKVLNLLTILILPDVYNAAKGKVNPLLLYGDSVRIEDAPFFASLGSCGAVILSDVWILTAAHCVEEPRPFNEQYVWVGGESISNSTPFPYDQVIMHEGYFNSYLLINDIALIKLATPLQFSNKVQPIRLPDNKSNNKHLVVYGRGKDETGIPTKYLKKMDLIRLTTAECISLIPKQYYELVKGNLALLEKTNICAKKRTDGPTICSGDSGGPLVGDSAVVGLVSYIGDKDCKGMRLGFYVNVLSYVPWIKKHTGL